MKTSSFKFDIYPHSDLVAGKISKSEWENIFHNKRSEHYFILFTGKFGAIHFVDDKQIEVPPHALLFLSPHRNTRFSSTPFQDTHVLVFSSVFYNRTPKDIHDLLNSPLFNAFGPLAVLNPPVEEIHYVKSIVNLFYNAKEKSKKNAIGFDLAHNIIQQILLIGAIHGKFESEEDSPSSFEVSKEQELVAAFQNLLAQYYSQENSVRFYADSLSVTERQLSNATKKCLGMTAKEVISHKIMEAARWQLAHQTVTIREISEQLGFSEEHNFSAFFKKHEYISPLQFRKLHQRQHKSE